MTQEEYPEDRMTREPTESNRVVKQIRKELVDRKDSENILYMRKDVKNLLVCISEEIEENHVLTRTLRRQVVLALRVPVPAQQELGKHQLLSETLL